MKLSNIKSNPSNPRVIKSEKFRQLVKSIEEFPEMMEKRPMVCVTDVDGKIYPLGGNMRLKALQELKYKDIDDSWVMMADDWTIDKRKEFTIKDNVGFGDWDWEALNADWDMEELEEWGLYVPTFDKFEGNIDDFFEESNIEPKEKALLCPHCGKNVYSEGSEE